MLSSVAGAGGLALRVEVGRSQVSTQLTVAHEGALRYDVVDWGSIGPSARGNRGADNGAAALRRLR